MKLDPGLLKKIVADPEDVASRLAAADWLEKRGAAPRAELIRAQVALRTRLNPARRVSQNKRVQELLKEHAKAWAAELPGVTPAGLRYSRGFIEEAALTEKRFAEHGEALLGCEPVTRLELEVQDGKGLAKVAGQPWFEQIRWLKLTGKVDAGARSLAAATHAGKLEALLLPGASVEGIRAVLGSEKLTGLRSLSLTGSEELDDEALAVFEESRLTLERLYVTGCLALEEGLSPLAEAEWLRPLKLLALNRNGLTDKDVKLLAKSEVFENLERLELAHNELTPAGVSVFKSPEVMPRLKHLDLSEMWYDRGKLDSLRQRFRSGLKL
jgi:uncharacterized protein (TIGR02996 family)